jgi:hypothetical protein
MKFTFDITHRWSMAVLWSGEVECENQTQVARKGVEAAVASGADLSGAYLRGADLSGAYLRGADLSGAYLRGADLSGADLRGAYLSDADLSGAYLRGADLSGADLSGADLSGADLSGADLRGAYLSGADLSGADLSGAYLRGAYLSGADLRGAYLSTIAQDIAVPSLHRRILAAIEAGGTLEMSTWHTCETTHCRAGWAIQLAGAPGRVLEACLGPNVAGALIHVASCPALEGKVPKFVDSNENALADIKRLAELEPALADTLGEEGKR